MRGKIASQVVLGVLILSTMGFTDLFADLTIGNFTAYVGSTTGVGASSGTPFASTFAFDAAFLGGEVELEAEYFSGPGISAVFIDASPAAGLLWDLNAGTDGGMNIFFAGPGAIGLGGIDVTGDNLFQVEYASNPFPHTFGVEVFDTVGGFSFASVAVPAFASSIELPFFALSGTANLADVDEFAFFFGGVGESIMEITSIGTTSLLIGGTSIPIDTTALLIAGVQTSAIWMLPTVLGIAGSGLVIQLVRRKKSENS